MDKRYINEFSEGERVVAQFLVQSKQLLTTKSGKPYISLILQDKTGSIAGRVWDNAAQFYDGFKADDVIKVDGTVELYNRELQLVIRRLRQSEGDEGTDHHDARHRQVNEADLHHGEDQQGEKD